jgi:hypothetical protein
MKQRFRNSSILISVMAALAPSALATSLSYAGNLRADATFIDCGAGCTLGPGNSDSEFAQFAALVRSFNVPIASVMQAVSFSYGGGVNGAGTTIVEGGLEPYLSLFDASGNFLASTYSGITCPPGARTNTLSGQCYDVLLDGGTLPAGNYQISLSAYFNLSRAENLGAGTLADGFTGLGNLAAGEDLHYAFDVILSPASSAVPEPASGALLAGGALILYLYRKRKVQGQK